MVERSTRPQRTSLPEHPHVHHFDAEIRVDRPYPRDLGAITYVGMVSRQTWTVNPHYHEHYELCYVDEGSGWFQQNGRLYEAHARDVFLSRPGECHYGAATSTMPFRLYYIGFQLTEQHELGRALAALGPRRVVRDQSGELRRLFDALLQETREQDLFAKSMTEGLFMQLLAVSLRNFAPDTGVSPPRLVQPAVQRALDYIHTEVGVHHTLNQIAQAAHLSRAHLTRTFRQALGVSVQRYIRQLSLDRACYLLRETDEPVAWIAEQLRFSSIHAFSMFFKRQVGQSPHAYRIMSRSVNSQS